MNKAVKFGVVIAALALFLAPLGAQDRDQDKKPADAKVDPKGNLGVFKTPDLLGKPIRNQQGEALGKLEDIVIDMSSGKVAYAVLRSGTVVGTGGKWFALPCTACTMAPDQSYLIVAINKGDLDGMTGFDPYNWPEAPDARWATAPGAGNRPTDATRPDNKPADATRSDNKPTDASRPDNKEPAANDASRANNKEPAAINASRDDKARDAKADKHDHNGKGDKHHRDQDLCRVSSVVGMSVKNPTGQDLGRIQGLALDLTNHKVIYAAMNSGSVAGVGGKYFAIPWEALSCKSFDLKPGSKTLVLHAEKATFDNRPGFDKNEWPTKADDTFAKATESRK